ncbi:coiled-coil domain-containing 92B [Hoplias malabaricus]|uniref:coiled-coil domain-containing 92B n=1 Tax=Hoplias malabaricus TaxID=27720 RepID=UPI003462D2D2
MESTGSQVVMDRSALVRQVESVERSIVFLRQEQLTLLHGLHLEILSLQKRCTELTRELNVKPPGKSETEVQEEKEQLEERCRTIESRLQEQQESQRELRTELSHKGALVGALRASLKEKERRFLEELKCRNHRSVALNTELQKQTEAAAHLSFQLHASRQKLQQQRRKQASEKLSSVAEIHPTHSQPQPIPNPSVRPKHRSGSRPSMHLRAERARECVPREKVMGPEEPMAMPDPALFLHPRRSATRLRPPHTRAPQVLNMGEQPNEADQAASRLVSTATLATATATESKAE